MDFVPFPKVPRLSREMIITEKLDGTNASVRIDRFYQVPWRCNQEEAMVVASVDDGDIQGPALIRAGSGKRWVQPEGVGPKGCDNFGFAAWVRDNAAELVKLGVGTHYGEWWGKGIQRGYGLDERRFSLFNVGRWFDGPDTLVDEERDFVLASGLMFAPSCCHVVPVLHRGTFGGIGEPSWDTLLHDLAVHGSYAAPGFMNPEGIMVFHTAADALFKKTFEGDASGKEAA